METAPSSVMSIFTPVSSMMAFDGLSSLADNFTDLLRVDHHLDDLRSELADRLTRLCDRFLHNLGQDVLSCCFVLAIASSTI